MFAAGGVNDSTARLLTVMLYEAGRFNQLAAAKWLREQGAEWPTVYKKGRWSGVLLEWAIAEGFEPPTN